MEYGRNHVTLITSSETAPQEDIDELWKSLPAEPGDYALARVRGDYIGNLSVRQNTRVEEDPVAMHEAVLQRATTYLGAMTHLLAAAETLGQASVELTLPCFEHENQVVEGGLKLVAAALQLQGYQTNREHNYTRYPYSESLRLINPPIFHKLVVRIR